MVFYIHPKNVEGFYHVITYLRRAFFLFNASNQRVGDIPTTGIELNQRIPTILQKRFQPGSLSCRALNQTIQHRNLAFNSALPLLAYLFLHRHTNGTTFGKRVEAFLEPAVLNLLSGVFKVGYMNINGFSLANPVKAPDALLKQIRVGGQIKKDKVMGKLEVTAFTTNFRADQRLRPLLFISKIRRSTVALNKAQVFMESRTANARAQLKV